MAINKINVKGTEYAIGGSGGGSGFIEYKNLTLYIDFLFLNLVFNTLGNGGLEKFLNNFSFKDVLKFLNEDGDDITDEIIALEDGSYKFNFNAIKMSINDKTKEIMFPDVSDEEFEGYKSEFSFYETYMNLMNEYIVNINRKETDAMVDAIDSSREMFGGDDGEESSEEPWSSSVDDFDEALSWNISSTGQMYSNGMRWVQYSKNDTPIAVSWFCM